ncbi:nucleotidyltransferase domain-containing protein [Thermoproteota archaeon]
MEVKYLDETQLKQSLLTILKKHLKISDYSIFYFGSRCRKNPSEGSDIDIGLEGVAPIELAVLNKIRYDINKLKTLYTFDLVDFSRVDNDFKHIAKQNIEYIHERKNI